MEEDMYSCEQKRAPLSGLVDALTDWTVWWLATAGFFLNVAESFTLFFPTISATMGYGSTVSLLLCVPPWFVGVTALFFIVRSVHPPMTRHFFVHLTSGTDIPTSLGTVFGI